MEIGWNMAHPEHYPLRPPPPEEDGSDRPGSADSRGSKGSRGSGSRAGSRTASRDRLNQESASYEDSASNVSGYEGEEEGEGEEEEAPDKLLEEVQVVAVFTDAKGVPVEVVPVSRGSDEGGAVQHKLTRRYVAGCFVVLHTYCASYPTTLKESRGRVYLNHRTESWRGGGECHRG